MLKKWLSSSVLAALVLSSASAQDASTIIANAPKAIGVESLKTVQYSATPDRVGTMRLWNPKDA